MGDGRIAKNTCQKRSAAGVSGARQETLIMISPPMKLPIAAFALLLSVNAASVRSESPVDFNRDIRPILSDKCFACHGPDEKHRKAKLRLDVDKVAIEREAIVPGKPAESAMIDRVTAEDESERMPPAKTGNTLTSREIELLKQWIAQGAKYQQHWAYVAPIRKHTPKTNFETSNFIDGFLFSRLESEAL